MVQSVRPVDGGKMMEMVAMLRKLNLPLRIYLRRVDNKRWYQPSPVGRYNELAAILLLANRQGCINEMDASRFATTIQQIGIALEADSDTEASHEIVQRAQKLYNDVARLDVQLNFIMASKEPLNPNDVAGVIPVHKNEFVANHEAVANPAVKQFLDVFDVAQKKGTIRMLNTTQILEQVRTRSGRYTGGYTYDNPTRPSATISAELGQMTPEQRLQVIALLQENNRLLAVLCNKELVVDPRKVRDGIKRVETLERNVRR